jgi:GrpB-like predicted nucleotidyltransferase (UPF0157 family)
VLIGPYEDGPAECLPYDPRAVVVADRVAAAIRAVDAGTAVEHVGSTAVPGCDGKGVVDLLVLYAPGTLDDVVARLDGLGFQPQTSGNPFPQERPMRRGTVVHEGTRFRVHAHVVREGTRDATRLLRFRDRLRGDDNLRDAYVAEKRALIGAGVTDTHEYSNAKGGFIRGAVSGKARSGETG